jgi:AbiTii
MSEKSQTAHVLELCRELLDDIELSRLPPDKLLFKCSRLARLAGSEEIQKWLTFEMTGYHQHDPISHKYMTKTARWFDYDKKMGFWGPFAQQVASIESLDIKLKALSLPDISGEWAYATTKTILDEIRTDSVNKMRLEAVRTHVLGLLHAFVSETYYEREFAALAVSTFERYRKDVDQLIAASTGDVLSKIPAVIDRLSDGSDESLSQALSTCRRIINSFADAIFPPTDATIEIGGNTLSLDTSKHLNRVNAYIWQSTESESRRKRLRQNLANLYDRVSTGVHDDVTADEAFSLFLNTYLFLAEVLQLKKS